MKVFKTIDENGNKSIVLTFETLKERKDFEEVIPEGQSKGELEFDKVKMFFTEFAGTTSASGIALSIKP